MVLGIAGYLFWWLPAVTREGKEKAPMELEVRRIGGAGAAGEIAGGDAAYAAADSDAYGISSAGEHPAKPEGEPVVGAPRAAGDDDVYVS